MPPPTPLHASERKLGGFMLVAIPLPLIVIVLAWGISETRDAVGDMVDWLIEIWRIVLSGSWPGVSAIDFFYLLAVCLHAGPIFLVPLHLFHLLGRRRLAWLRALWLWSAVYGVVAATSGTVDLLRFLSDDNFRISVAGLSVSVVSAKSRFVLVNWRLVIVALSHLVLGLVIAVPAFRAWWRRRRADEAASVADSSA